MDELNALQAEETVGDPECVCRCEGCEFSGHCGVDFTGCDVT